MKMIKILQAAVVLMFLAMVVAGIAVFIWTPEKLDDFARLIGVLYPIFLAQVVPALIGTPLTEAVRNLTKKGEKSDTGDGR